jgi:hypothetical protein
MCAKAQFQPAENYYPTEFYTTYTDISVELVKNTHAENAYHNYVYSYILCHELVSCTISEKTAH